MSSKFALISSRDSNIFCTIFDDGKNTNPKMFNYPLKSLEKNLENALNQLIKISDLQNVVFTLFDFDDFILGYKLRLKCKEFCDKNKIKTVFLYNEIVHASATLLAGKNLHISVGEKFCMIIVYDSCASVYSLFQDHLYCIWKNLDSFDVNDKEAFEELAIRFMSEKIIISYYGTGKTRKHAKTSYEMVKSYFKGKDFIDINIDIKQFIQQSCKINAETYLVKKPYKFAIMPFAFDMIGVIFASKLKSSTNILNDSVTYISQDNSLPSSFITDVQLVDNLIIYKFTPPNEYQILEKIDTSKFRNFTARLCLKIDVNCFYQFFITDKKEIMYSNHFHYSFPKCIISKPKKIPMIFFENNVFEIGLTMGNKYCILEGYQNIPACLGIDENQQMYFGSNALKLRNEMTLIYDLLKIISAPPDTLQIDPKWKFKLVKDENNQIFIVFNTKEGPMQISLILCMAATIKKALKIIEFKTAVVAEDFVEIGFPDFCDQTKTIIQEAGKKLNLQTQLYDNFCYRDMELVKYEKL